MRMMKNNNNETVMVIGIDHGYGNMKTATRCFPSGVVIYDKEPIFQNNLLVYNGMYYQIGEEHKEFCAEKTQDEDYYVLTLAAIARELDGKGMNRAKVHIAAGLPLTWVATQKEDFQKYLLQMKAWILYSAIKSIMWSLQVLIFTHRDLQQPFTAYRILRASICWQTLEMGL